MKWKGIGSVTLRYADTRRPIEELTVDSGSRRVAICERDREFEIDIDLPGRYRHEEWAIAVAVNGRLVEVHKSNPFDEREGHYIRIAFPTGLKHPQRLQLRRPSERFQEIKLEERMGLVKVAVVKAFFGVPYSSQGLERAIDFSKVDEWGTSLSDSQRFWNDCLAITGSVRVMGSPDGPPMWRTAAQYIHIQESLSLYYMDYNDALELGVLHRNDFTHLRLIPERLVTSDVILRSLILLLNTLGGSATYLELEQRFFQYTQRLWTRMMGISIEEYVVAMQPPELRLRRQERRLSLVEVHPALRDVATQTELPAESKDEKNGDKDAASAGAGGAASGGAAAGDGEPRYALRSRTNPRPTPGRSSSSGGVGASAGGAGGAMGALGSGASSAAVAAAAAAAAAGGASQLLGAHGPPMYAVGEQRINSHNEINDGGSDSHVNSVSDDEDELEDFDEEDEEDLEDEEDEEEADYARRARADANLGYALTATAAMAADALTPVPRRSDVSHSLPITPPPQPQPQPRAQQQQQQVQQQQPPSAQADATAAHARAAAAPPQHQGHRAAAPPPQPLSSAPVPHAAQQQQQPPQQSAQLHDVKRGARARPPHAQAPATNGATTSAANGAAPAPPAGGRKRQRSPGKAAEEAAAAAAAGAAATADEGGKRALATPPPTRRLRSKEPATAVADDAAAGAAGGVALAAAEAAGEAQQLAAHGGGSRVSRTSSAQRRSKRRRGDDGGGGGGGGGGGSS